MTIQGWLLILVFVGLLLALTKPMGLWLFALYEGRRTPLHAVLGPVERGFYRLAGIDPTEEMRWQRYAVHMLMFNAVLMLLTYAVLRLQACCRSIPAARGAARASRRQHRDQLHDQHQLAELCRRIDDVEPVADVRADHPQFPEAATGIALAFAFFRGFARREARTIGNFWADCTRITLYLLLPISIVYALYLVASGVPQTLAGSVDVATLEGAKQTLALGPVASQEAIKMLGTNGGGFFNANSAHPFENPSARPTSSRCCRSS